MGLIQKSRILKAILINRLVHALVINVTTISHNPVFEFLTVLCRDIFFQPYPNLPYRALITARLPEMILAPFPRWVNIEVNLMSCNALGFFKKFNHRKGRKDSKA